MAAEKGKKSFFLILAVIFIIGGAFGFFIRPRIKQESKDTPPSDIYVALASEIWDRIEEDYWDKISSEQLADLFVGADEKILSQPKNLKAKDKANVEKMVASSLKSIKEPEKKREFVLNLANLVLLNIKPAGRSRLLTQQDATNWNYSVNNFAPQVNYYGFLGLTKEASISAIKKAYQDKVNELKPKVTDSPEAQQNLAAVEQVYRTLGNEESRLLYDATGTEPSVSYSLIKPDILYLRIFRFTPGTSTELQILSQKTADLPASTFLILDLRANTGGAIENLPLILGPFIGPDQYAYQLFHQEDRTEYKTKSGWLPGLSQLKKVVILIDKDTQWTAEVMANSLKKYNVGVLVGTPTKGWGTIDKIYEIDNQPEGQERYSMLLAQSITMREDNQPIEGRGVDPTIDTKSSSWEKDLYNYYRYDELVQTVKEILATK